MTPWSHSTGQMHTFSHMVVFIMWRMHMRFPYTCSAYEGGTSRTRVQSVATRESGNVIKAMFCLNQSLPSLWQNYVLAHNIKDLGQRTVLTDCFVRCQQKQLQCAAMTQMPRNSASQDNKWLFCTVLAPSLPLVTSICAQACLRVYMVQNRKWRRCIVSLQSDTKKKRGQATRSHCGHF